MSLLDPPTHKDPLNHSRTDWQGVVALMPEVVKEAYQKQREARSELAARLLAAYAERKGGLTTYDPDHDGWTKAAAANLEGLGERLEVADFEAMIQRSGLIAAHQQIVK